jgi:hypothetical protein
MRLSSRLLLPALAFGLTLGAAPTRAQESERCVLKRATKVSIANKWETLAAGEELTVTNRGPEWAAVTTSLGAGKTSVAALDKGCPAAPAAPAAPALVTAAAPAAAPVDAPAPAPAPVEEVEEVKEVEEEVVAPAAAVPSASLSSVSSVHDRLVAVMELRAGAGAEAMASALATVLTAEVGAQPGYKTISRNELRAILTHQADAQLMGCEEIGCLADVAKLANADLLVHGQVDKIDGAWVIGLTLLDPAGEDDTPTVVGRQEAAFRGPDDQALALVRPLVQRLAAGPMAQQHTGALEVFATEGAAVFVNGREAGSAPLQPLRDLPTGVHTLRVEKAGHIATQLDVVVARNETTISRVTLEEEVLWEQPWFWAAAGAVVLVAGGSAAGITTWAILNQDTPSQVVLGKE